VPDALPRRARVDAMLVGGIALVGLQAVVRIVLVSRGYFWQDDFLHLSQARTDGFSPDFILQDYNDHLEPAKFTVVWLVLELFGFSYAAAATTMVVLQLATSLALLWVLRRLFGHSVVLLVPFAAYLFTPLGLVSGTWWAASLEGLPLQLCMLLTIGAASVCLEVGSWRWAVASWAAFVLGLLFWEKALLILPALLATVVLVMLKGMRPAARWSYLRASWRLWVGHLVIALIYLVWYVTVIAFDSNQRSNDVDIGEVVDKLLLRTWLPGLFGGPWSGSGAENTLAATPGATVIVICVVLAAALVLGSFATRGIGAIEGWLLLACYLWADVFLVLVGRTDFASFLARDPRYVADALPIAVIAVCAAYAPPVDPAAARPPRVPAMVRRPVELLTGRISPAVVSSAVIVVICSALFTTTQTSGALRHEYARTYTESALGAARADPSLVLVDSSAPPVDVVAQPVSIIYSAAGVPVTFDAASTHLSILNGFGEPRPVTILAPALEERGPRRDCGWLVRREPKGIASVERADRRSVLRLGYFSGGSTTLEVTVGGLRQEVSSAPGLGEAFFPLGDSTGRLRVAVAAGHSPVCVSDVSVGVPWPS
jgi:hypothetical protein